MAINLYKQPKRLQESQKKIEFRKIYCDGCRHPKNSIEMQRKLYHSEIYCSECYPLLNSKNY